MIMIMIWLTGLGFIVDGMNTVEWNDCESIEMQRWAFNIRKWKNKNSRNQNV